jgi:hypothetical protein
MNRYEQFTSFEAACTDQGREPIVPDYSMCTPGEQRYHIANFKYATILRSVNKDEDGKEWNPLPTDRRFSAWVDIVKDPTKPSGFGLSLRGVGHVRSFTRVAARLGCRDRARTEFMFENHQGLMEDQIIFIP